MAVKDMVDKFGGSAMITVFVKRLEDDGYQEMDVLTNY